MSGGCCTAATVLAAANSKPVYLDEDALLRIVGSRCDQVTSQLEALLQLHQLQMGEKIETLLFRVLRLQGQAHRDLDPKLSYQPDVADEGVTRSPAPPWNSSLARVVGPIGGQVGARMPKPAKRSHPDQNGSGTDGAAGASSTGTSALRRSRDTPPSAQVTYEPPDEARRDASKHDGDGLQNAEARVSVVAKKSSYSHHHFHPHGPHPRGRKTLSWTRRPLPFLPTQFLGRRVSVESGGLDEDQQRQRAAAAYTRRSKPPPLSASKTGELSWRGRLERIVQHPLFDFFVSFLIISNAAFLGWQAQYTAVKRQDKVPGFFFAIQVVYGILFLLELILRIAAEGKRFLTGANMSWNLLDVAIVLTSISEVLVEFLHMADVKEGRKFGLNNLRVVRILRIVRLVRVIRVAKLLRFIHALRTFIFSILATLKALVWALLLLVLIIYVFGIAMTQACLDFRIDNPGHPESTGVLRDYWGDLGASMYTLFKSIAGGLSWDVVIHEMHNTVGFAWVAVFTFYIAFTYFAVLNVVTGIFCQSAIETAQQNEDLAIQIQMANKEYYRSRLNKVFNDIDDDQSGLITLDELEEHLDDENMQLIFTSLDIAPYDAWTLFKLLDADGSHEIGLDEFIDGLMRWRGNAKRTDVVELQAQVKKILNTLVHTKKTVDTVDRMLRVQPLQAAPAAQTADKHWHSSPPASDWDVTDLANSHLDQGVLQPLDQALDAITGSAEPSNAVPPAKQ